MPDTVEVRYIGPGSATDKRTMKVTADEAAALEKGGLWAKAKKPATTSKKKDEEVKTDV